MSTPGPVSDAGRIYRRYLSAIMLHGHAVAKMCGLGATDLYALNILELSGPMTPGELSARDRPDYRPHHPADRSPGAGGYVRRGPAADDRRKLIVEPVGQPGELDAVMAPARDRIGDIISGYTPAQRATLFDYFTRATEAFQQATEDTTR